MYDSKGFLSWLMNLEGLKTPHYRLPGGIVMLCFDNHGISLS